jgi:hypothetical protein
MSREARREMGFLLRLLQEGEKLSLPLSRPMPIIGTGCHELRVNDENKTWRLFYHLDTLGRSHRDFGRDRKENLNHPQGDDQDLSGSFEKL